VSVRAIRGATCLVNDSASEMAEAVQELLSALFIRNEIENDDLISIMLTATPDLVSAFPAAGARGLGLGDVPLICAQEINVSGALPRVVRVMVHAESPRPREHIVHVYLRGAEVLRQDLAQ